MRFFNFYVAYMVQKYQNESAPIFYYVKSPKTSRKHLNIPYLQALTLGHIIKMTLYLYAIVSCFVSAPTLLRTHVKTFRAAIAAKNKVNGMLTRGTSCTLSVEILLMS